MRENDPRLQRDAEGNLRYQGRVLDHQDEPVVDQGLRFDLGTLVSRRNTLAVLGAGAAAAGLAACGSSSSNEETSSSAASDAGSESTTTSDGEIPEETNGPYPADGTNGVNVLTESGIVRQDITSSFGDASGTAEGVAMTLTLTITNMNEDNAPYEGVAVYVWHCTGDGLYSLYSEGLEEENFLRGVQIADANGQVTFTSIFPGCYAGRWPHIHFEVYPDQDSITDSANAIATSQVALPQDACETVYATSGYEASVTNLSRITLATDNVFGNDSAALQLGQVTGDVDAGYTVTLPVGIDTTTVPTAAAAPGGDGQPGGPPPGN